MKTLTLVVSDPDLLAGLQAALDRYNADLPQTIQVDGIDVPNPKLIATVEAYFEKNAIGWLQSYAGQYVEGYVRPSDEAQREPTPEELVAIGTGAVQLQLDAFAKTRGYDNILSACTYATSGVPKFAAEGQYCVDLRDNVWAACYAILADVQAGNRPMPTLPELLAELPDAEWPNTEE